MAIINKNPRGLSSLLGLFQGGKLPTDLSDIIVPTVELTRAYLLNDQVGVSGVLNPVPGNGPHLTDLVPELIVPQGEVWLVNYIATSGITGVGGTLTFAPAVRSDNITSYLAPPMVVAAANLSRWNPSIVGPLWLKSGDGIGVVVADNVGAANIVAATASICRLRA